MKLIFKNKIFFSEKLQINVSLGGKKMIIYIYKIMCLKAALESGRTVILASGMEDRRKCQIKRLDFKCHKHSDRDRGR